MTHPEDAASVVIVGGGLAGLFCALRLAPRPVTVLAAAPIGQGASSAWAQGGIAAAMGEGDTVEKHLADTLAAGAGLVDEEMARGMIEEGPARVHDLLGYGVPFDSDLDGRLALSREAAHSERRIVRVNGDMAGRAIMEALVAAVRRTPSITVIESAEAFDLRQDGNGTVAGVRFRRAGEMHEIGAGHVVLASGGIGHLFAVTTNPSEASGRGLGMAARAGALVADPEFVQFHPTAIDIGRDPAPLATEALRGEGATLVNRDGRRFMPDYHGDAELAPRDIVARAIFRERAAGRGALLDARESVGQHFASRFPTVHASCIAAGIDPAAEPIPLVPAAHYHMGGLWTDRLGRTSLPGLSACGEVASTGVHGANRLASNSLLEAVVFAARVAADVQALDPAVPTARAARDTEVVDEPDPAIRGRLRALMSDHVGVVRSGESLATALDELAELSRADRSGALRNELASARLVAAAALARQESRGAHFRTDRAEATAPGERTLIHLDDADASVGAHAAEATP